MVSTRTGEHASKTRGRLAGATTVKKSNKRAKTTTPMDTKPSETLSPDLVMDLELDSAPTRRVGKSKSRRQTRSSFSQEPDSPLADQGLTAAVLKEVFKYCDTTACRTVLPLVCKQWARVLAGPSDVWKDVLFSCDVEYTNPFYNGNVAPSLEFGRLERWILPRAGGVQNLMIDTLGAPRSTESSINRAASLRSILKATAPTLQSLFIDGTDLGFSLKWSVLRDISAAKNLKSLTLQDVDDVPLNASHVSQLQSFNNLKTLNLSWLPYSQTGTTTLHEIPSNLFNITTLEVLKLKSRTIGPRLSSDVSRLGSLQQLSIESASLNSLPKTLVALRNLKKLSVANNPHVFSDAVDTWNILGDMPILGDLNCSDCNIQKVPELINEFSFPELVRLDLSNNQLGPMARVDGLPCHMYRLRDLSLRSCQLSVLPSDIRELQNLTRLDISRNQLVDLPSTMEDLDHLKLLMAGHNCFPALPAVIDSLTALERLDMSACVYLETATSLERLVAALPALTEMRLTKEAPAAFQQSSKKWLTELNEEFKADGRGDNVVKF